MSRFRAWGAAAALLVGAGGPAVAAEPPKDTADTRPWYKKMFSASPKPTGPTVRSGPVLAPPGSPSVSSPVPPEVVADAMRAEREAWDRRMAVCLKLRQVALDKNDDPLLRQVDELERQANAIYQQRMAALGVPKVKAPLPPNSTAGFAASFDLAPEKPVTPQAAAARLVAPAAPVPVSESAEIRTVKPEGQP